MKEAAIVVNGNIHLEKRNRMPIQETHIQHSEIMPFFCRREEEGGLGYVAITPNMITSDLFVPSHLEEFVSEASPLAWNALVHKYHHDTETLINNLCAEIRRRMMESSNTATFLSKNQRITFEGETLQLFFVGDTEISGDRDFSKNIFAAVEEMSHNIVCNGITLLRMRPDITFFVNGIYLGYLELKSITNGQTAKVNGRGKIIADYLESVKGIADRQRMYPEALNERRSTLFLFEKAIHLVATDIYETYVLRNIASFFDDSRHEFYDRTSTLTALRPNIEQAFKLYPISTELLSEKQRFEEVMRALYSKKMIEKEILYYNFLQYKYVKQGGKRERTSNRGTLISPRPKQKFGCDKIIDRVREMLDHETDPNFYSEKLRVQLQALSVQDDRINEILAQRDRYCNNKYVYSLLLQYAAGFGKSNIIGWTALQLKDLRHNGVWAYDKIMIVVDRLQLRDQLDTMMMSMNIDKSMFVEVTNQDKFVKALSGTKRIIVVNIQKFLELQNALNKAHTTLQKMRVAFLIDEIHRSNTGENQREMVNLFERLQETINQSAQTNTSICKKNLIVGFTATPTEKVLARFGEFKSASIIPTWVPFDSYTMKEAINDGYILDPTKHIIPVPSKIHFEAPDDYDPDANQDISIEKTKIYSNPERMEQISRFIVNRLVSLVYGKINGQGKAMLAVSSIPNAIAYCNTIRRLMEQKCSQPLYQRYANAPIAIVYSDNQLYESSASMNNGIGEAQVIQDFKLAKNGLMIVVDKLQTGFDEPKLHTLFLDKEVQDINAIQTISRVNRTCKYKEECHVVDFSWKSVNVTNIQIAFKKYCGITTSSFNPEQEAIIVKMLYDELCKSEPYGRWYREYKLNHNDTAFVLRMEDGIRQWIRLQFERTAKNDSLSATDDNFLQVVNEAKELRKTIGKYGASIMMLEDVLDIDAKYKERLVLDFWEIYCRIYRSFLLNYDMDAVLHPDIEGSDEIPGITVSEEIEAEQDSDNDEQEKAEKKISSGVERPKRDILAVIQAWNESEQLSQADVRKWMQEIGAMFTAFTQNERLLAVLQDDTFPPEEKQKEYTKALNRYRRSISTRMGLEKVELFKRMLADNNEQLLDIFMTALPDVQSGQYSFDFQYN